ncbi:MAG: hypothetical protein A7316_03525 [Candidatus Altiarchaeales archaeon WOR_SM1_86-2]|nr:MAG: hypothetical protein A7316_03525 [Candidatus Altiarchaeales archaeon WOR_SM1_86-2]
MVDMSKMMMPAIVGGLVAGILSGIPLVNLCCCLWFVGGGAIAAWMLIGKIGKIELMDGAIVGGISGVIAGVIGGVIVLIIDVFFSAVIDMSDYYDYYSAYGAGEMMAFSVLGGVFRIIIFAILGAIFGAVGGVIVAKLKE